jgi:hypothetical protein
VGFLVWLEATGLAEWARSSTEGYPSMITLHAFGMAIMVGLSLVLDLRLLGKFVGIPYAGLQRFFGLAWVGFLINTLSGTALFSMQATMYIVDWVFMTKMACVFLGAITTAILQTRVASDSAKWPSETPPGGVKAVAALGIVFWLVAIILGRLTAYLAP